MDQILGHAIAIGVPLARETTLDLQEPLLLEQGNRSLNTASPVIGVCADVLYGRNDPLFALNQSIGIDMSRARRAGE